MTIRVEYGEVRITALDRFLAEMFRRLPECAATDDDATERRIFPNLTGGADAEADADWKEVVEPELRELYESHVDVVRKDVAKIKMKGGEAGDDEGANGAGGEGGEDEDDADDGELTFPLEHGRAWLHTLNQARLALGARHDVSEDDMEGRIPMEDGDKAFAIMQINFFGMIMHVLLQFVEL